MVARMIDDDTDAFRRLLRAKAEYCFAMGGGDRDAACNLMCAEIELMIAGRPDRAQVVLRELASRLIREAATDQRQRIARRTAGGDENGGHTRGEHQPSVAARAGASWSPPANEGAGLAARRRNDETVFDWQLPGGLKLGLGTLVDLRQAHDYYRGVESSSRAKKSLLDALLKKLRPHKDGTRVQDILALDDLATLFRLHGVTS